MFLQSQNASISKSALQTKRQSMHQSRATQQRDKIKKSMRFDNLSKMLLQRNYSDYEFILQITIEEAQQKLRAMMESKDMSSLICCIFHLQSKQNLLREVLNYRFLRDFMEFSQNILYHPQVIGIYMCLSCQLSTFYEVFFEYPRAVQNIIKQIQSLKRCSGQEIYLEVLEHLTPHYPKRYNKEIGQLFDAFCEMLQNETVDIIHGIKILKSLSPFINKKRQFSLSTINRLIAFYEDKHTNQSEHDILQDIFLIFTKVIFYQQKPDLVTNWRLVKVILHANSILSSKVIQVFYNFYNLLARLITNTGQAEICDIPYARLKDIKHELIEKFAMEEVSNSQLEITTMFINQLLLDKPYLLGAKQFTTHYLNFIIAITKYCTHEVLLKHFLKAYFFEFLAQGVDHTTVEVYGLALEVFQVLLKNSLEESQTLDIINYHCNLKTILEKKLYSTENHIITDKITLILERFDQFRPES